MNKQKGKKPSLDMRTLKRVLSYLFKFYPVMVPLTGVCIVLSAIVSAVPAVFLQKVFAVIGDCLARGELSW